MTRFHLAIVVLLWGLWACQSVSSEGETSSSDSSRKEMLPDSSLADVFQPWDGHWKGTFSIYLDPNGQLPGKAQPRVSDPSILDSLGLELSSQIAVEQFYESTSPFYQTVRIVDTYADGRQVESAGYNEVRGDSLLCVVNKPGEQVVHIGKHPAPQTIIWGRKLSNPTTVEYFYEKVEGSTYSILGWGYYGKDDPSLTPKMWFYATYERVE